MRHRKKRTKLGRSGAQRKAVLRNTVKNLLRKERITVTLTLAKAVRPLAERLITLGKQDTVAARRRVFSVLNDRDLVALLFSEITPRFAGRQGGYTRIIHLAAGRRGDNARMAVLEFTELKPPEVKGKKAVKDGKAAPKKGAEKPLRKVPEKTEGKPPPERTEEPEKPQAPAEEKAAEKPKAGKEEGKGFIGGLRKFFKKRDSDK